MSLHVHVLTTWYKCSALLCLPVSFFSLLLCWLCLIKSLVDPGWCCSFFPDALLYLRMCCPCLCWAHLWACCGSRHSIPWLSAGESLCQGQQPCTSWQIEFLWSSTESTTLSLPRNSRSDQVGVRLRVIFKSKSWELCLSFCFPGWTSSLIQKIL